MVQVFLSSPKFNNDYSDKISFFQKYACRNMLWWNYTAGHPDLWGKSAVFISRR